ncbi:MAG TPA: methyltransferase domain-containing protein [Candidatus Gracilibacteria bacterium]|nr:methyltransferase domain-containing protein [Candidatus Gracilibacteria bacterium]
MREKKAKKVLEHVKATYGNIAESFSSTRHYIGREFTTFLPYLQKAKNILDLGCGNGRFVRFLEQEKLKAHYIGMDNAKEFIEICQKEFPRHTFKEGDQLNIPLSDETQDLILNIRAFHHLPSKKHRINALKEMHRVLNNKGILIISVWNLWQLKYWKQLVTAIIRSIISFGSYAYNDTFIPWQKHHKRYYHAFTQKELKKILEQGDFNILQQYKVGKDFIIIAQKGASIF